MTFPSEIIKSHIVRFTTHINEPRQIGVEVHGIKVDVPDYLQEVKHIRVPLLDIQS